MGPSGVGEATAAAPTRAGVGGRWWRPALLVVIVLVAVGVALAVGVPPLEEIRGWVAGAGWAGPVVYAAVYAGLSMTPAPISVLSIGGGALFGLALGVPATLAGAIVGAVAGFALTRRLGRDSMVRLQERAGPGAARLAALDGLLRRNGLIAMIGIRLAPVLPFALLNMGCGLTAVRMRDYTIGTAIGMTPGATALVAIGAYGSEPGSLPFLLSVGGLAVVLVAGAVLARTRRSAASAQRRNPCPA